MNTQTISTLLSLVIFVALVTYGVLFSSTGNSTPSVEAESQPTQQAPEEPVLEVFTPQEEPAKPSLPVTETNPKKDAQIHTAPSVQDDADDMQIPSGISPIPEEVHPRDEPVYIDPEYEPEPIPVETHIRYLGPPEKQPPVPDVPHPRFTE